MPSHHRLPDRIPHKVDLLGIAVALAILVGIGVFAGNQDQRRMAEDPTSNNVVIAEVEETLKEQKDGAALDLTAGTNHDRDDDLTASQALLSPGKRLTVD